MANLKVMFQKLIDDIAAALHSFDLWFSAGTLGVLVAGWYLVGISRMKWKLLWRLVFSLLIITVAGTGIYIKHRCDAQHPRFADDVFGILLLQISGDDATNFMQEELAAALSAELQKETLPSRIVIRVASLAIDETLPLREAHLQARGIGERFSARLVVWGNRVADRKAFLPQVTLIAEPPFSAAVGEYDMKIQILRGIRLPYENIGRPFFLTHFLSAFVHYYERNYAEALNHLELAIGVEGALAREVADLHFCVGACYWNLAQGRQNIETYLRWAVSYFEFVAGQYGIDDLIMSRAMANHNLGIAYLQWPIGDKDLNMRKAIITFETALRGRTENDASVEWAMTYFNLAEVYADLPSGDRATNLKNAIAAYANALRIYTGKDHPKQYAVCQNNMGALYVQLPSGDRTENLYNAIAAYESALEVYTKDKFPEEWALTQNNIGLAYARMPRDDLIECFKLAQTHLGKAAVVLTTDRSPAYHRQISDNLAHVKREIARLEEEKNRPPPPPVPPGPVMGLDERALPPPPLSLPALE